VARTTSERATGLTHPGNLGALVLRRDVVHDGYGSSADHRAYHDGGDQMSGPIADETAETGTEAVGAKLGSRRNEDVVAGLRTGRHPRRRLGTRRFGRGCRRRSWLRLRRRLGIRLRR
jgi:hypothetical protein